VDTGATLLSLHKDHIEKLGLTFLRTVKVKTVNGSPERKVYGVARVEIQGREGEFNVLEIPDDVPVLVGYVVLEILDFVPDTSNQRLIPNPAHGGEYAVDLY
jgi:predicted aspartyl protease